MEMDVDVAEVYETLKAKYRDVAIPLDTFVEDYMPHLRDGEELMRRVRDGRINLTVTSMADGQKSHRVVLLQDAAAYIVNRRNMTAAEQKEIHG